MDIGLLPWNRLLSLKWRRARYQRQHLLMNVYGWLAGIEWDPASVAQTPFQCTLDIMVQGSRRDSGDDRIDCFESLQAVARESHGLAWGKLAELPWGCKKCCLDHNGEKALFGSIPGSNNEQFPSRLWYSKIHVI